MMQYLHIHWLHSIPQCPVEIFSEIDEQRFEVRKVEVFADGRAAFASTDSVEEQVGTRLGETPIPDLEEIAADEQFRACYITKEEFEGVWSKREVQVSA